MNIDPRWPGLLDRHRRFHVRIPILGHYGNVEGMVQFYIIAKNAKQARAHARKEMLKLARISANHAQVVDIDPGEEYER